MEETVKNAIQVIYAQISGMTTLPDWETCENAYQYETYPEFNEQVNYIIGQ